VAAARAERATARYALRLSDDDVYCARPPPPRVKKTRRYASAMPIKDAHAASFFFHARAQKTARFARAQVPRRAHAHCAPIETRVCTCVACSARVRCAAAAGRQAGRRGVVMPSFMLMRAAAATPATPTTLCCPSPPTSQHAERRPSARPSAIFRYFTSSRRRTAAIYPSPVRPDCRRFS